MTKKPKNILILGIGNILMGDEGVGVRVAQFNLIEYFQNADVVILIDATVDGNPPGSLNRLEPRYSSDYPRTLTAHDIGLKDMLDAVQILGNPPKVRLFAISISSPREVTLDLTSTIQNKIPELAHTILKDLDLLLGTP